MHNYLSKSLAEKFALVEIEKATETGPESFADSAKLSSLIEFMRCYPSVQKREKGHGSSLAMPAQTDKPSKAIIVESKMDDSYVK